MAKYGELWADSALVKALDDAISKYKIMHYKGGANGSIEEERIMKNTEESEPIVFNGSNEAKSSCVKTDDNTNGDQVQDTDYTHVDAQTAEDYNNLLSQYNAVEEQRQKLLGQLYQYGNWDYQDYGYGAGYDSQYQPVPASQPTNPPICSCHPYVYPSTAPCTSSCTVQAHNGSLVLEDGGVIKAAMGAIDKAIHSFNSEDKEGKKGEEKSSQTDLSVVLNAWFSAGFYTGKYLSEQASVNK